MAITHHVQIRISSTGLLGGESGVDLSITLTDADFDRSKLTLDSGDNTIAVPTTGQAILFIPPTTNTETIQLKGVTGDTGITLDPAKPSFLSLATDGDDIVLVAGGEIAGCEILLL